MSMRHCPACAQDLYPGESGGALCFQCEACRGAWFLAGRLAQAAGGELPSFGIMRSSGRLCPDCKTLLDTVPIGTVEAEWCGSCEGVYLDAGEIDELRRLANGSTDGDLALWLMLLPLWF